jgi:hypothetical protein
MKTGTKNNITVGLELGVVGVAAWGLWHLFKGSGGTHKGWDPFGKGGNSDTGKDANGNNTYSSTIDDDDFIKNLVDATNGGTALNPAPGGTGGDSQNSMELDYTFPKAGLKTPDYGQIIRNGQIVDTASRADVSGLKWRGRRGMAGFTEDFFSNMDNQVGQYTPQDYPYDPDWIDTVINYGGGNIVPSTPIPFTQFVDRYLASANKLDERWGIFPEVMFAQAYMESNDGKGNIDGAAFRNGNNVFNIHADPSWKGATWQGTDNGQPTSFRAYPTLEAGIADYYNFLLTNKNYSAAFSALTPEDQIDAIAKGGFATNPSYAKTVKALFPTVMQAEALSNAANGTTYGQDSDTSTDTTTSTDNSTTTTQPTTDTTDTSTDEPTDNPNAPPDTSYGWDIAGVVALAVVGWGTYKATDGFSKNPFKKK